MKTSQVTLSSKKLLVNNKHYLYFLIQYKNCYLSKITVEVRYPISIITWMD